jgi:hypothetical protein
LLTRARAAGHELLDPSVFERAPSRMRLKLLHQVHGALGFRRLRANRRRDRLLELLKPADYFVSLVEQALPWSKPEEAVFPAYPGPLPTIDHQDLHKWLDAFHHANSAAVPWKMTAKPWITVVFVISRGILEDFRRGELDLDGALAAVRRCSIATGDLDADVSYVANQASVISTLRLARGLSRQPPWNKSRPTFPTWFKCVAVTLVRVLVKDNPDQRVPPTSPVLKAAMDWLETLGVAGTNGKLPSPTTVRRWYLTDRRQRGKSPGRGRPVKEIARSFD